MTRVAGISLLLLLGGYFIWGVAFNLLYGLHAIACDAGWQHVEAGPTSLLRVVLGAAYAAHIAAFAGLLFYQKRLIRHADNENIATLLRIGLWLAVSALFASAFILLSSVVLQACSIGPAT